MYNGRRERVRERVREWPANHRRQAPGLEGGKQMAPGRAALSVYECPSRLMRLSISSCPQHTNMVCVEYVSVLGGYSPPTQLCTHRGKGQETERWVGHHYISKRVVFLPLGVQLMIFSLAITLLYATTKVRNLQPSILNCAQISMNIWIKTLGS